MYPSTLITFSHPPSPKECNAKRRCWGPRSPRVLEQPRIRHHSQLAGDHFDPDLVAAGRTRFTRLSFSPVPLPMCPITARCSTVAVNSPTRVSRRTPKHHNYPANLILFDVHPAGFEPATGGLEVRGDGVQHVAKCCRIRLFRGNSFVRCCCKFRVVAIR